MSFSLRAVVLFLLAILAPLGTRLIFQTGEISGIAIEAGTLSIYMSQLLAIFYVGIVVLRIADTWGERLAIISHSLRDRYNAASLAIAAVTLTAAAFSANPLQSMWQAVWVVLGVLVFMAIRLHKPGARLPLAGIAFSGLIQAFLAIEQFLQQRIVASTVLGVAGQQAGQLGTSVIETFDERWLRAYGTFPHPNALGFFLAIAILSTIGLAFITPRKEYRGLTLFLPFLAAGMFFTLSRSAIMSQLSGLSLFMLSFFGDKPARHNALRIVGAVSVVVITIASLALIFRDPVTARITGNGRLETQSNAERISSAKDAFVIYAANNPIIGVGPGQMPYALAKANPERQPWQQQNAHVVPLLVLVETGIAGAVLYMVFAFMVLFAAFKHKTKLDDSTSVRSAIIGLWFTCLFAMLLDHFLWSLWSGVLVFWMAAGIVLQGVGGTNVRKHKS
jgi:hypothetical protein